MHGPIPRFKVRCTSSAVLPTRGTSRRCLWIPIYCLFGKHDVGKESAVSNPGPCFSYSQKETTVQRSVEFGATSPRVSPWIRVVPAAKVDDGPKTSFRLVVVFLLILYSSIAVWYKPLDALRPALVVALGALLMLIIELGQTGKTFRLSRPQGI